MNKMEHDNELIEELIKYQQISEDTIQKLNSKVIDSENKIAILSSVLSISEYINHYFGSDKILPLINDVLIGVLGASHSTIYVKEKDKLILKDSNFTELSHHAGLIAKHYLDSQEGFLINCKENLCENDNVSIHSSLGVPICLKEDKLGFIIVEHEAYNYFNEFHVKFIKAICNQVAICFENNNLYNKIKEISNRDYLTGLFNRNYFYKELSSHLDSGNRNIAIAMIDFDNFKNCNDKYGHLYGDHVLKSISKLLIENVDETDIVCRFGGEEIIICLLNTSDVYFAYRKMEGLRKLIENKNIAFEDINDSITVSIGVSVLESGDTVIDDVIKKADNMLYLAKKTGKNRVESWNIQ